MYLTKFVLCSKTIQGLIMTALGGLWCFPWLESHGIHLAEAGHHGPGCRQTADRRRPVLGHPRPFPVQGQPHVQAQG